MDSRLAELLSTVDPGELGSRIRAARIARDLTQSELASDLMSVGYVSRIESGHRRPKPSVLEAIAERVGVSIDQLLGVASSSTVEQVRLQLDYAELALETGSVSQAREHAEQARGLAESARELALAVRARFLHARALENDLDYDQAIIELEDLLESDIDRVLRIKVGIALSRCYRESGDLSQAIDSAQQILDATEAAGLAECDEAVQLTVTMAAAYFERGDVGQAVRVCHRAIATAERLDSPMARAAAYWNASMIEAERNETTAAVDHARKALTLLSEGSDARNLARLRLQYGLMQLHFDPSHPLEARSSLTQASDEMAMSGASPVDRARVTLGLAGVSLIEGDMTRVRDLCRQVYEETLEVAPNVAAQASSLLGQSLVMEGRAAEAVASLQQAAMLLTGIGADRFTAQQWFELAEALEETGETESALQAYRSAAAATGLRADSSLRRVAQQHQLLPIR